MFIFNQTVFAVEGLVDALIRLWDNSSMFRAINDWVIVRRDLQEQKTESGIILNPSDESQVLELEVYSTTEETAGLEGKTVLCERHKVRQLNPSAEEKFGAVKLEDVLAVKE